MLRNVLFASAVVSIASCLTLFAAQATEDEAEKNVGKNKEQQAEKDEPDDKDGDDRQAAPSKSASQTGQWKNSDHCFASCVALGNQEEVALGKLASKKSENEDVKKF
ncbi:MAG: hypothetical protein JWM11_7500, partial [Planctomycetaceae bacterium]|nr:hypothetical protein [Planctomycetaceae bacterium]